VATAVARQLLQLPVDFDFIVQRFGLGELFFEIFPLLSVLLHQSLAFLFPLNHALFGHE
jgi:hypothetical protein